MNGERLQWLEEQAETTIMAGDRTGAIAKAHAMNVIELIAEVRRLQAERNELERRYLQIAETHSHGE